MSKQAKQISKFKVREFQWFEMETKVRQMVQQLMNPYQKRIMQNATGLNNLRAQANSQALKLQQIRLMITNDPKNKEIQIFKQIQKQFQNQSAQIAELRNLLLEQQKMFQKRFLLQDERLKENGEILLNNMHLKERVNEEIRQQNQNIIEFRSTIENMINALNAQINKCKAQEAANLRSSIQRDQNLEARIQKLQTEMFENNQQMARFQGRHTEIQRYTIQSSQQIKKLTRQLENIGDNLGYTKKLVNYVQQMDQKLKLQDFSLQALSPLVTQAQISQCLYSILPVKLRKRLIIQEYNKYHRLNQQILENDYKQVKLKFNGIATLQAVQKRNTKEIIEMKRKKLIAMGIDIDNITYEQREKYYREITFNQFFVDQDEEQSKATQGVDQNQIIRLITGQLNSYKKQIADKIKLQLQDSKKYIYNLEEEMQNVLNDAVSKFQASKQTNDVFQTEQALQNKIFSESIKQMEIDHKGVLSEIKKINQNTFSFIQFCSLVNHLQIQDQLDKQSISLYGIKETFNEANNNKNVNNTGERKKIIDFNEQCFSCCGYPASTIAAFKMACLTYNPSEIQIDEKQYRRQQILEISTKILQYIKNRLPSNINDGSGVEQFNPRHKDSTDEFITDNLQKSKYKHGTEDLIQKSTQKWKKTKRFNTSAHSKVLTRTFLKSATKQKQDFSQISYIFSENKRRNLSFLG